MLLTIGKGLASTKKKETKTKKAARKKTPRKKKNRVYGCRARSKLYKLYCDGRGGERIARTSRHRLPIPFIDGHQWADGSPYHFGDVHKDQEQRQKQHFSSLAEASASDLPTGHPISEIPASEFSNLQPGRGWRMKPAFCTPGTLLGCYPLGQGHSREGKTNKGEEQDERRGNDEEAGAPRRFFSDLLVATPSF
jgi:hypothetical protein